MATQSVTASKMDSTTAYALHQVDGILELVRSALSELGVEEPVPDGVQGSIMGAQDILRATMARAGLIEAQS